MDEIIEINTQIIYDAIYESCLKANINLSNDVYQKIKKLESVEDSEKIQNILKNIELAQSSERPLCQDTGQVIVFVKLGQNAHLNGLSLNTTINQAISDCYQKNFLRKSIVQDALNNRINTNTNTPAIIYPEIIDGDEIFIDILIKGGGAENMSQVKMLAPTATKEEILNTIYETVKNSGKNACPPLFLGVGVGGTIDYACLLSKKALLTQNTHHSDFEKEIQTFINESLSTKVADVKILSTSTHIASLPICVTLNCHSMRHVSLKIYKHNNIEKYKILTEFAPQNVTSLNLPQKNYKRISTNEISEIKKLRNNEKVLLSGEIYTARDMAHKKLVELIKDKKELPVDLKNKIIFYAGPCPATADEIIGPIGPTTSKRMAKYAPVLFDYGVLATIGKGELSQQVKDNIIQNNAVYFTAPSGVACLLQQCIKKADIVAFPELGAEAIYKLEVENFPIQVDYK